MSSSAAKEEKEIGRGDGLCSLSDTRRKAGYWVLLAFDANSPGTYVPVMVLCGVPPGFLHLVQNLPDLCLAKYSLLFKDV